MALTVTTNLSSLIVQNNLNKATNSLNSALERLSTGYKINHASDNAAGYSITENWKTLLGSIDVASQNAAMGMDLLQTAEENYGLINSHLQRVRDLTEQAANGTYGIDSLMAIKSEIKARLLEINRVAANTEYNGIALMGSASPSDIELQVGINANTSSVIKLDSTLFGNANISAIITISGVTTKSAENYANAFAGIKLKSGSTTEYEKNTSLKPASLLANIDTAMKTISNRTTELGSAQNRVDSAISSLNVQSMNLTSSLSTIRDTDVASTSSAYIQAQILQQASATLLATANQSPSVALNLL